jgi:hypothetical protein
MRWDDWMMDDHPMFWMAMLPALGQSLSSGCTADPSEEAEISDSDSDDLPSVREIIARSKSTIDLTLDDDDDSAGDENAIERSWAICVGRFLPILWVVAIAG